MTTSTSASGNAALFRLARTVIPGGVNSSTRAVGAPEILTAASGAYVVDADGRRYLDYHAAFGAILLGHGDPLVNAAVADALGSVDLVGWGVTELEIEFARLMVDVIPSAQEVVAYMSGSEATFNAVRLARAVTKRTFIVKFQGCFHGWHDAVARNVISRPELAYGRDPISAGILDPAIDATLIADFNDPESVEALFRKYPDQIAAVIVEPIAHNVGVLLPDPEFHTALRRITHEYGALLIFDEVITGFRHALGGYQSICQVEPDLTTFGKGLGNGFPVAGLAGSTKLLERFNSRGGDVLLAGTYNGHPTGLAAAIATVSRLRENNGAFYERTYALGEMMRAGLTEIIEHEGIRAQVQGFGSVFCVYFMEGPIRNYRDLLRNDDGAYIAFHRAMIDSGVLMLPMSLKRNHISGAHTVEDVEFTLERASIALRQLRNRSSDRKLDMPAGGR